MTNTILHTPSGLTEQWEASIDLFHSRFGGKLFSDELLNQRSAKENMRQVSANFVHLMHKAGLQDPYDGPVYEHAKKLFEKAILQKKAVLV